MPRTPQREAPKLSFPVAPESFTVHLKTITPMFGGGAETRKADERNPVRAASIRGHLRFWWRATVGASYADAKVLFDAESDIWGRTPKALKDEQGRPRPDLHAHGKVRVEITEQKAAAPYFPSLPRHMSYVTFPFQEQRAKGIEATQAVDAEFKLKITCPPALRPQVEAALHAWIFFGGIGSRTRRGCGGLELLEGEIQLSKAASKGEKLLTALPKTYFLGRPQSNAVAAWAEAVKIYADFRQGDGIARTSSEGRPSIGGKKPTPGRSFWPEPDTLRRETKRASHGHEPRRPEADGYPRADLGLPIGFQFKHEKDPEKLTLQGATEKHERFASPVITKAVVLGGKFYPMLVILDSPHVYASPYGVALVKTQDRRKVVPRIPTEKLALIQKNPPQNNLQIRQALAKFVRDSERFQEVTL